MRLVIGSKNSGKIAEVAHYLGRLGFEVISMAAAGAAGELPEESPTFAENALSKASALASRLGGSAWVLADDSGLEVDALGGAPGVRSARYAGIEGDGRDAANNKKLLEALAGVPSARRTARFVCHLALLGPDGAQVTARGACEGRILEQGRGESGFGYDPLFLPAGFDRTMAELGLEEKNRISHRGRALAVLVAELEARGLTGRGGV